MTLISILVVSVAWLYFTGVLYAWQQLREETPALDSGDWALILTWPIVLPLAWALRKFRW